jgi:hypothetical protein
MKSPVSAALSRSPLSHIARRFLSALCLAAAGVSAAVAQCYLFSSNATGVSLKVDITNVLSSIGPVNSGGGRSYTYVFLGNYTLTNGQSVQVSAG